MAHEYDTDALIELAVNEIELNELVFFAEISTFIGVHTSTLYNHNLHENEIIKAALRKNKISKKLQLRKEWGKPGSQPTLQLALYKLLSDDDERKRLSQSYVDHTTDGEKIRSFDLTKASDELLDELFNLVDNDNDNDPEATS